MRRSYKILLHICYWLYSLGLLKVIQQVVFEHKELDWRNMFSMLTLSYFLIALLIFYTNYFVVLPKFFKTKQFGKLWLAWLVLLCVGIAVRFNVEERLYPYLFDIRNYNESTPVTYYILDNIYFIGIYIVISTVLWTADFWIRTEKEKNILQKEVFDAELNLLKNQVNPHFLFNTLNNIYSLSFKKSDSAPESILKLSSLMRYMLKDSSAAKVLLSKELNYIKDFIDLQRLRYPNGGNIIYTVSCDKDTYQIAPLLLIPFIENGFKHGETNNPDFPLQINISIENGHLLLFVKNIKAKGNKDESNGIGLVNVQKRLMLLYPGSHALSIKEDEVNYICQLTIHL
ncbi:sensor histidine kinase [Ferruginibacter sp. HRS2-29]|uniref:sensor histidine kinase n=1 Tax=Ferruginibacter sp. HRS2-29 TaxID=2487334 RepID=UPI0020CC80DD|nr:histidine kinase [Ferruginibacter sp. HRS2-29]MCP9752167.1 histidine kinase [Ferruginibacter sp. HRS2-29]